MSAPITEFELLALEPRKAISRAEAIEPTMEPVTTS